MPGKLAARVSDQTTHGSPLAPGPGSLNTQIGFLPAWRTNVDQHACPAASISGADGVGAVVKGSPTVFINNQMACRVMDIVVEKPGLALGPANPIANGCATVEIGDVGVGASGAASMSFATADEAARAALELANPQSISANMEYSGLIYQGADGRYYFTGPAQGTDQGANPLRDAPVPAGATIVGDYHTHGDYSTRDSATGAAVRTNDPAKDAFNSDNFSRQDKLDNNKVGYPGYLGTPSGTFRRYDPADGSDTTL